MRSIRTQLVLWLVSGTLVLTVLVSLGLYSYMDEVLEHGLDTALAAKADAIRAAVHLQDDGQPHLQKAQAGDPIPMHREGTFYFQIWRSDGTTIARSAPPAINDAPLPHLIKKGRRFADATLPDGTRVRITQISFFAQPDDDEPDPPLRLATASAMPLVLVVAHDRRSIDGPLAVLMTGLLLAAGLVGASILLIVTWGVNRGLKPLADLSALADRMGPESLDIRFPGRDQLPAELLPIALKLNDLLDRLANAFARERRFSTAVAHELRTPLAELRTACDVALRWPDDAGGMSTALSEARDVSVQMSQMVHTLLLLARQQVGVGVPHSLETVPLISLIDQTWSGFAIAADQRHLILHKEIDPDAIVQSDPALLRAVLRNLLDNAVAHATEGGRVVLKTVRLKNGSWSVSLINTCNGLQPTDMQRIFEPFWRSDVSRTGHDHVGLGLTLVKAYCDLLQITVRADLISATQLEIVLRFPPSDQSLISSAQTP